MARLNKKKQLLLTYISVKGIDDLAYGHFTVIYEPVLDMCVALQSDVLPNDGYGEGLYGHPTKTSHNVPDSGALMVT